MNPAGLVIFRPAYIREHLDLLGGILLVFVMVFSCSGGIIALKARKRRSTAGKERRDEKK